VDHHVKAERDNPQQRVHSTDRELVAEEERFGVSGGRAHLACFCQVI
jgi:hypothetical protein